MNDRISKIERSMGYLSDELCKLDEKVNVTQNLMLQIKDQLDSLNVMKKKSTESLGVRCCSCGNIVYYVDSANEMPRYDREIFCKECEKTVNMPKRGTKTNKP